MAEQEWTLVEYRPGRFVKVSPEGEVLGRASEAEARAWFARRGWPLTELGARQMGEPPSPADRKPTEREPPAETAERPVPSRPKEEEGQAVPVDAGTVEPAPGVAAPDEQRQPFAEPDVPQTVGAETEPDRVAVAPTAPEAAAAPPGAGDELLEKPPEPDGPPEKPAAEAEERWLWLDPRGDARHSTETFDIAAFLRQASSSFRAKDWTGGCEPGRLAVHPDLVTGSLEAAANELELEIVADPRVMLGTYMLGLAQPGEEA
jgi:hypothetical protein